MTSAARSAGAMVQLGVVCVCCMHHRFARVFSSTPNLLFVFVLKNKF